MKTVGNPTMKFGFSAVNAGQRVSSAEPQIIAVSTEGSFRLTNPVSKVLALANGDHLMFVNNFEGLDQGIFDKDEDLVAFAEAAGLPWGEPETTMAIYKEFGAWVVAKGIQEFDPKGNARVVPERLTKEDKLKFVQANYDAMLEGALADADDQTKDALSRDGITVEEISDILTAFVRPKDVLKYKGSKLASNGGVTGTNVPLTFTDSNVWKQLKGDMKENATKANRVYSVDLDSIQTIEVNNGYENVTVKALILADYTDKEPVAVGKKAKGTEGAETEEEA